MGEDRRDVQSVGAGHAVLAVGAGDGGVAEHHLCRILQQGELLPGELLEGGIGADVVLQMLHVGHAAQHGEHPGPCTREAEGPRGGALRRALLLEASDQIVVQPREATAEQRFHDNDRDVALLQFAVEVFGIEFAARSIPVDIVQLDLDEIPLRLALVVHGQHVVEELLRAVERPSEVPDPSGGAFALKELQHAVVDETRLEGLKTLSAERVEQVVVDVVDLQLLERLAVEGQRILARIVREVRHLGGDEVAVAGVALEGDARRAFGKALEVDRSRIEVVDAVGQRIVDQLVDRLLIDRVAVRRGGFEQRPAHAAVAEQRDTVTG